MHVLDEEAPVTLLRVPAPQATQALALVEGP
jgi:hypothetical protein